VRVPKRSRTWILGGRVFAALIVGGLIGYLIHVGLDKADKISSVIGGLSALVALVAPLLLPSPDRPTSPTAAPRLNVGKIDVPHASGVQINQSGGNVQHNTFPGLR